jgi:hypothetical protein
MAGKTASLSQLALYAFDAHRRLMLVAAGSDIKVFSLPAAVPMGSLVGHREQVTGIVNTKDPKVVISCSMDGTR